MENTKQDIELADIFSDQATHFLNNHNLCPEQQKAFNAIIQCRTAVLGGHVDHCDNCGYIRQSYNSCRNRHCPKCQFIKKEVWVDKLMVNLLPVKHFHIVFTIPSCLHKLFYINQACAYSLLFKAAGKALIQCAANPEFVGAQAGAVGILHTWGQTLIYHPHIHMIVPAGGLSEDQMEWVPAGRKFFLPVKALSAVYRGILCRLIEQAVAQKAIKLPDDAGDFNFIKTQCYKKKWVVYCEKPFSCANNLIRYLGNYTHRVAISNQRLLNYQDGKVSFSYKNYKMAGLRKTITLDADEFISRFMHHVLPCGFYKIRYYGFMAICNMKLKLQSCFELIGKVAFLPVFEGLTALEVWRNITGGDPLHCPKCNTGKMIHQLPIATTQFKSD
ncbi:IS91 family transposase [Lacibacter sp.]|uniref:IS91 family transposase n=1 Tax=Lacibacter sp. TaxID=1915409 RepID=UPI002B4B5A70|nr:IS91 family transposase [Lacibacter sp.]HLP38810.1 IS91 family transposase [Lacibacter sp.]